MTKSVVESSEYIDKTIIYEYLEEFSDSYNIDLSIKLFCSEVRKGIFPSEEFCYVSNKKTNNNVTYIKFNEK